MHHRESSYDHIVVASDLDAVFRGLSIGTVEGQSAHRTPGFWLAVSLAAACATGLPWACQGLDYGIDFYVGLAREAKGPVLDIASGTGRALLPVLQARVDADGMDLFQPMLDTARRKAAVLGLAPALYRGNMANFRMPRRYALVTIAPTPSATC